MLVPMVDVVFADVAQPDQARIVGLNAQVRCGARRAGGVGWVGGWVAGCGRGGACVRWPAGGGGRCRLGGHGRAELWGGWRVHCTPCSHVCACPRACVGWRGAVVPAQNYPHAHTAMRACLTLAPRPPAPPQYFLKNGGNFVISIKASCIDSTAPPEAVFAREVRGRAAWMHACRVRVVHVACRARTRGLGGGVHMGGAQHVGCGTRERARDGGR